MTREEAIETLGHVVPFATQNGEKIAEAIDIAIEALHTEVVLCKDCIQKHIGGSVTHYYWCDLWDREVDGTDYCAWGERREP